MRRFIGKTAVITGAGNGIGRATAIRLADEGARIILIDRDGAAAEGVAAALEGGEHHVIEADTTDAGARARALASIDRLDVLINNAGGTLIGSLDALDLDGFESELALTLGSTFAVTHALLPRMLDVGGGAIVFNASVNALTYLGNPAYSVGKAGILQLMRAIAVEYGPRGIRSNAVSPGSVRTAARSWAIRERKDPHVFDKLARWYPVGRVGRPEDIAAAIVFLAADEAAFVNGANLVVDGGLTAGMGPMIREFVTEDD